MLKILSMVGQATVAVGMLAAMPKITASLQAKLEDNSKLVDAMASLGGKSTALKWKPGAHNLTLDKALKLDPAASIPNLSALLAEGTDKAPQPDAAPVPTGPTTVIRYAGQGNCDNSGKIKVTQVPVGANATFVDGRLQVYHPSPKPKTAR